MSHTVPDAIPALHSVLDTLQSHWRLQLGQTIKQSIIWYDSFDWRLYRAGLLLAAKHGHLWQLQGLEKGHLYAEAASEQTPGFVHELPEALSAQLQPLLGQRRLLPRLQFQGLIQQLAVLDDQEKTLVRLRVWCGEQSVTETQPAFFIQIEGLKGYHKAEARLRRRLKQAYSSDCFGTDMVVTWLHQQGCRPGDYSSKLDFTFQPTLHAAEAVGEILGFLLQVIRVNIPGASQGLDTEFLHDLRVAVRRTRSALSQLKVFDPEALAPFREGFGWLGQISGPTRDLDVHLLQFPRYLELLPTTMQEALLPLRTRLFERQQEAQDALATELASEGCQTLLHGWQGFLESQKSGRNWTKTGSKPVLELANGRIWRSYLRLCTDGHAIDDQSPAEALHRLRKDCKKLRYLLEFFQHLYPRARLDSLVYSTKALLDALGSFQDLEVQARSLASLAEGLFAQASPGEVALQQLIKTLGQEQMDARILFIDRFAELVKQRSIYKALFAQPPGDIAGRRPRNKDKR